MCYCYLNLFGILLLVLLSGWWCGHFRWGWLRLAYLHRPWILRNTFVFRDPWLRRGSFFRFGSLWMSYPLDRWWRRNRSRRTVTRILLGQTNGENRLAHIHNLHSPPSSTFRPRLGDTLVTAWLPCRCDAPWASVPYGADPSAADSSDALRDQHRADFSKCEPRVAAAMAHEDADADRDRLTNEI